VITSIDGRYRELHSCEATELLVVSVKLSFTGEIMLLIHEEELPDTVCVVVASQAEAEALDTTLKEPSLPSLAASSSLE
jgi:hypothetical protein